MNKTLTLTLICIIFYIYVAEARDVTDQLSRRMTIPDDPKRIIALAPSITELIFAVEQEHRLVGVTRFSDYPPEAESFPQVGSYIQLDLERIVALKPDLCIAVKDGNPIDVVKRIESFGIPVYAVDPRNLNAVIDTIKEIGNLLHADQKAFNLAIDMENRIQNIKLKAASFEHRPTVFFQIGISPIVAVGNDTFIHELITLAGGKNLTAGNIPYPRFTKEQVITLAPEIFIITSMAREAVFEEVKKEWQQWHNIPAIRNNRIYLVDSNLFDRAGPRLVEGLELLFNFIHPNLSQPMPEKFQ